MKKKEHVVNPVDNGVLTVVEPEEVDIVVYLPNLALGNQMQGSGSFRILEQRVQMTQVCGLALFQHLLQQEIATKFDEMGTTDGEKSVVCAESVRVLGPFRKTKVLAAIPAGTNIGPITEVHFEQILDEY